MARRKVSVRATVGSPRADALRIKAQHQTGRWGVRYCSGETPVQRVELSSIETRAATRGESPLDAVIEALCRQGCRQVRSSMARLEQGEDLPETSGLTATARLEVLAELRAIMAVYGETCRID
ncbi:hypothetical protein [uncultured Lamprocystis sp.]|jgi:hypothetical protein|uniref:hypothetical protein n=1 Tax=uncultured Lamprocystis sp. TaxID=543132 RepID=UPI0025CBEBC0|nr:hypothetical protein [uncultured Lamprocystis sp.]